MAACAYLDGIGFVWPSDMRVGGAETGYCDVEDEYVGVEYDCCIQEGCNEGEDRTAGEDRNGGEDHIVGAGRTAGEGRIVEESRKAGEGRIVGEGCNAG